MPQGDPGVPGPRVGPWRLSHRVGHRSWSAVDERSGQPVVVRVADRRGPGASDVRAEAAALAALGHGALARGAGVVDGPSAVAVATTTVDGPSLASLLDGGDPLPWPQVAAILAPVAHALAAVHDSGWVHGDVSAANVVVAAGHGVLVDLACARPAGLAGATGTPGSVAPEVADGAPVTSAADVYALAAVAAAAVGRDLPPAATLALRRALDPDPGARPTAAQLAAALDLAALEPAVPDLAPTGQGRRPQAGPVAATTRDYGPRPPTATDAEPARRRRPGVRAAAVVALLVGVAGAGAVGVGTATGGGGPSGSPPPACPPLPSGSRLVGDPDGDGCDVGARWAGGVLTIALEPGAAPARVAVGAAGDVVGLGDWDCDGDDTPGVLRPASRTVVLWDEWPLAGAVAPSQVVAADGFPRPDCR